MHERSHNEAISEKRGDVIITRGMSIFSRSLGISGKCDVLEFHKDSGGVPINGWDGLWLPFPVEYKRGEPKQDNCDMAQLCAQALCLEEMLCCNIPNGAMFYGETRRRLPVEFTVALRQEVTDAFVEMHELYKRGYSLKVKPTKSCRSCSMNELCLPTLLNNRSVKDYLEEYLCESS